MNISGQIHCRLIISAWAAFLLACAANFPPTAIGATINGTGWKGTVNNGTANTGNWSNSGNWDGSVPASTGERNLFFGNAYETAGGTNFIANNDIANLISYRITFENVSPATSFTLQGNSLTLQNFGPSDAVIENDSTVNQNLNFGGLQFAGTLAFAEINAINGGLIFGSTDTISFSGASISGIKLFGGGQTVTFNNTINGSGKWFAFTTGTATGNTVNLNGSMTVSDFYVMNNGTLNLDSSGSLTGTIRLGADLGTTGNQDLTKGGKLVLTNLTGNQTVSNTINAAQDGSNNPNTSGALIVDSQNTSNSNTLSGHIILDSVLRFSQAAGGTLNIAQGRATAGGTTTGFDVKTRTAAFEGAGNFVTGAATPTGFGTIYDSISGAAGTAIIMNGTGSLTLNDANSYRGKTQINSGTLFVAANNALGSSNGTVGTTGNTVLLGNTTGSNNSNLLTTGAFTIANAIQLQTGNSGTVTLGGNAAAASIYSGAITTGTANAVAKDGTFVALGGGSADFQGVINEASGATTTANVNIDDPTHTGTVKFSNTANQYDGVTTINAGTLEITKLSNKGTGSSIGNSNAVANAAASASTLVINGATLKYTGTGDTTDRLFTIGTGGATIDASASANGAVTFTNTGSLIASGIGSRTLTLTGTSTGSNSLASVIANPSNGTTNLAKSGSGTWQLLGNNTYSGLTTINAGILNVGVVGALGGTSSIVVNSGGTLMLSNSVTTDHINDAATITLNGGTLNTGGVSEHGSVGIGALTLQESSKIDFFNNGATSSVINFANSSAVSWPTNKIVTIKDWTGSQTGGGADQLIFGSDSSGLTASQIAEINFLNPGGFAAGTYSAQILSTGEIVPLSAVPEPSTWAANAMAVTVIGYMSRRSLKAKADRLLVIRSRKNERPTPNIEHPMLNSDKRADEFAIPTSDLRFPTSVSTRHPTSNVQRSIQKSAFYEFQCGDAVVCPDNREPITDNAPARGASVPPNRDLFVTRLSLSLHLHYDHRPPTYRRDASPDLSDIRRS